MRVVRKTKELRELISELKQAGDRIALVPTMGNLHEGHLQLVKVARTHAERVVATIFVNPTQFGPAEDFGSYPRTPQEDVSALESVGADILFMPDVDEVYPRPLSEMTAVNVPVLSETLCGAFRPGHFKGVATVVLKLFNMVGPDCALFGEKDFQQLRVIRQMVTDLNLPIDIHGVPTVREQSGLAMSSRNAYLSPKERSDAAKIYETLVTVARGLKYEQVSPEASEAEGLNRLSEAGFNVDYFAVRRAEDLALPVGSDAAESLVILVAARLGKARLIDNLKLADLA